MAASRMKTAPTPWGSGNTISRRRGKLRSRLHAAPDQRLGTLHPGNANLELGERGKRGLLKVGHECLHHARARRDVAPHRASMIEARRERKAALKRHQPMTRLKAHDAAAGGRDPDRPAGVCAECRLRDACCERRRRAST